MMNKLYILLGALLFIVGCDTDLDQFPPLEAEASSLTDYGSVLNAAYYYQQASTTPLAVMGDFRADNFLMEEEPYPSFDRYDSDLAGGDLVGQFFQPFYSNLYKSILSSNNVIENSTDASEIGEAKFLRALSYFKLVKVFGGVTMITDAAPPVDDKTILARATADEIYTVIIIPDLNDAMAALDNEGLSSGRATQIAARGMLGKVHMQMGNFNSAETDLAAVVNGAGEAGISMQENFADIFGDETDLNSEIIFATQLSTSIEDEYGFTLFSGWFSGGDTKSLLPLDDDLVAAFDASPGDLRRDLTIDADGSIGTKWGGLEQDWIELRLGDVVLLYAEALNENGDSEAALTQLNKIRTRAGLEDSEATGQGAIRQAIADERRLELACEGQRWFDLVRTGTVDAEMGMTINANFHLFPLPDSEVQSSSGAIVQNPGYEL